MAIVKSVVEQKHMVLPIGIEPTSSKLFSYELNTSLLQQQKSINVLDTYVNHNTHQKLFLPPAPHMHKTLTTNMAF